ncbi:DUF4145 domain-containing protein [Pantoea sp. AMG 501]|uniref:DUF4145 domain-containing protein n=1 Tax=Pantoea sp. AMG 501 TaxID=2008894 RepID=UPI000B5A3A57|nr:DUF4145 domain-containing protein [Pantoea sp. AMG 501]OWY74361.1 hypothetical protein CDN97_24010 [Pantoea sp. AMG 501]
MKGVPSPFTPFTESRCPDWRCPSCLNQTLKIKEGTFHYGLSADSKKALAEFYNVYEVSYVFSCLLQCTRAACSETVAVNGEGWCDEPASWEPGGIHEDVNHFRGLSFTPPLPLFAVPEGCPDEIAEQLKVISSLLTVNRAAAANAIRHLLEILMDVMKVPDANKTLHYRIQLSLDKFGDETAAIHALRAVGNAGSHGNAFTFRELEEACLVLESVVKKFCHSAPDISHIVERLAAVFNVRKQQ